jgi:hypothetical protein
MNLKCLGCPAARPPYASFAGPTRYPMAPVIDEGTSPVESHLHPLSRGTSLLIPSGPRPKEPGLPDMQRAPQPIDLSRYWRSLCTSTGPINMSVRTRHQADYHTWRSELGSVFHVAAISLTSSVGEWVGNRALIDCHDATSIKYYQNRKRLILPL